MGVALSELTLIHVNHFHGGVPEKFGDARLLPRISLRWVFVKEQPSSGHLLVV